jgi:hypothetical protein
MPQPSRFDDVQRWVATFPDGEAVLSWGRWDGWRFEGDTESDTPIGRVMRAGRTGWPWVPGWSLPETGFDPDVILIRLYSLGATHVDGPCAALGAPPPPEDTIVG